MDRQQRRGRARDRGGHRRRIEVQRDRIDVGEHRTCALVEGDVRAGDERERRRDHLVAVPDADGAQREVQAGGAGRDGARVRGADARGEGRSNAPSIGPERQPARSQHLEHELLLALADHGPGERELLDGGRAHEAGRRVRR